MKNNFSHVSVALFMLIFLTACGSQLTDSITEESGTNAITVMKPDDILATADEAAYSSYSTEDTNSRLIALRSFSNEYVPDNISFLEFADLESALQ